MGQVINPYNTERVLKTQELKDQAIKMATARRSVVIKFKNGDSVQFDQAKMTGSEGQVYAVFLDQESKVYKYPFDTISSIEETLIYDK